MGGLKIAAGVRGGGRGHSLVGLRPSTVASALTPGGDRRQNWLESLDAQLVFRGSDNRLLVLENISVTYTYYLHICIYIFHMDI